MKTQNVDNGGRVIIFDKADKAFFSYDIVSGYPTDNMESRPTKELTEPMNNDATD